jgi:predicted GNAT family acetyltransferase
MDVRSLGSAGEALDLVTEPLRAAGAEGEVSFGILRRLTAEPTAYGDEVTILVGGRSAAPEVLVTMTGPHPAMIVGFIEVETVSFPDLVQAMLGAGHRPGGVNGARRWSEPFARAFCDVAGARAEVRREVRAFELRAVRRPRLPEGRFRTAAAADTALLEAWMVAFGADIDEPITPVEAACTVARLAGQDDLAVWEADGRAVSMAAVTRRTPWSSSIGLVYTPPPLRARGYASAVTAELSQRELDAGRSYCSLLTDLANPTSNRIYAAIGYEPKCDLRHLSLTW